MDASNRWRAVSSPHSRGVLGDGEPSSRRAAKVRLRPCCVRAFSLAVGRAKIQAAIANNKKAGRVTAGLMIHGIFPSAVAHGLISR